MTSQSVFNQSDRNLYNQQLSDYYSALANAPREKVEGLSQADEAQNEILEEFLRAGTANLIDKGIHNVKDLVNKGIKKVAKKGVEAGKEYGKRGLREVALRAGVPEETVEDLLEGRLEGVKTTEQALNYIKRKAQEAGSKAVAEARDATGDVSESVINMGERVADESARARGIADGALNEGEERIGNIASRRSEFHFNPVGGEDEARGVGFFNRMGRRFGGNQLREGASVNLLEQTPREISRTYVDPFTGSKVDLSAKYRAPGIGEDIEGLTDAVDAPQLNPRVISGIKPLRVDPRSVGELLSKENNIARQIADNTMTKNKVSQDLVFQKADELGKDYGRYIPRIEESATKKATESLADIASRKAVQDVKPGYRVLADLTRNASSEQPLPISILPDLDKLDRFTPGANPLPNETAPVAVSKNPTIMDEESHLMDRSSIGTQDTYAPVNEFSNPAFMMDVPSEAGKMDDEVADVNLVNPFKDDEVEDKINDGLEEGEAGDNPVNEDFDEAQKAPKALKEPSIKTGEKVGEDVAEDVGEGVAEGAEVAEAGGLDPVADIVGLGLALGSIFGGVFGQKHESVSAPPVPNYSNPSVPVGI